MPVYSRTCTGSEIAQGDRPWSHSTEKVNLLWVSDGNGILDNTRKHLINETSVFVAGSIAFTRYSNLSRICHLPMIWRTPWRYELPNCDTASAAGRHARASTVWSRRFD